MIEKPRYLTHYTRRLVRLLHAVASACYPQLFASASVDRMTAVNALRNLCPARKLVPFCDWPEWLGYQGQWSRLFRCLSGGTGLQRKRGRRRGRQRRKIKGKVAGEVRHCSTLTATAGTAAACCSYSGQRTDGMHACRIWPHTINPLCIRTILTYLRANVSCKT